MADYTLTVFFKAPSPSFQANVTKNLQSVCSIINAKKNIKVSFNKYEDKAFAEEITRFLIQVTKNSTGASKFIHSENYFNLHSESIANDEAALNISADGIAFGIQNLFP